MSHSDLQSAVSTRLEEGTYFAPQTDAHKQAAAARSSSSLGSPSIRILCDLHRMAAAPLGQALLERAIVYATLDQAEGDS